MPKSICIKSWGITNLGYVSCNECTPNIKLKKEALKELTSNPEETNCESCGKQLYRELTEKEIDQYNHMVNDYICSQVKCKVY